MPFETYLKSHPVAKIQLGCGGNLLPGWLNTDGQSHGWFHPDGVKLDASQPFPIRDNCFDYVYSEHMIEHLTYWGGQNMLGESFRILKPGGRIRISCPNFQFLIDMYTNPEQIHRDYVKKTNPEWAPYADPIFTFNNYVRDWGHQFIYDKKSMQLSLVAAGFENVEEYAILESTDPELQNLEIPSRMSDGFLQLETMTFEGVKPL
jgi:predicted SAM-dependent methyltransferase